MSSSSPRYHRLADWLDWQETLHPSEIDLGLERVRAVADRAGLLPLPCPAVVVAGTNGKGSAVAMYEAVYRETGLRTGAYTSPHLLRYNERIRVAGREVSDSDLCASFARLDAARGELSLTYFEFGTLAALDLFARAGVDVALLEVGLGGRLDAVNVVDADLVHFGSIDIDHVQWLGPDREAIGGEKAGVLRPSVPAVCADSHPPASLRRRADALGAQLRVLGEDFSCRRAGAGLVWQDRRTGSELAVPRLGLRGGFQRANAAAVIAGLRALSVGLPIGDDAIVAGLARAAPRCRVEVLAGEVTTVVDVAHNPDAARALAAALRDEPIGGRTFGAIAMLADKDVEGVAAALAGVLDGCFCASVDSDRRGLDAAALARRLRAGGISDVEPIAGDLRAAWTAARRQARVGDRIVVCGSFYAVGGFLAARDVAAGS